MSSASNSKERSQDAPWLAIVGVGADGVDSLSPQARAAIARAELVVGGARHLALVHDLVRGEREAWPAPFAAGIELVLARRGRATCVLASGDPFFYGVGATLAARLAPTELTCYPAPSSPSLAAARLGWALQAVDVISLHGRDLLALVRYLAPGRQLIALSWDRETPVRVAELLCERGFAASRVHVLEALGRSDERLRSFRASDLIRAFSEAPPELAAPVFDDLNLVALELEAGPESYALASRGCLPDSAFEHDGQLTKQDVRAITLSALAPRAGALLWDVGAGAGSVAIEWMRSHPACRAVAIERELSRCERVRRNARALGVPALEVVHASAPDGLAQLPRPDAIFVGGGASDPALFARCWEALPAGGRLVLNAVALETEALVLALYARYGGALRRLSIETAGPLGAMTGFRPAMPVVQWRIDKP